MGAVLHSRVSAVDDGLVGVEDPSVVLSRREAAEMQSGLAIVAASLGVRATEIRLSSNKDGSWTGVTQLDWARLDSFAHDTATHAGAQALIMPRDGSAESASGTKGQDPTALARARLAANRDLLDELVAALLKPNPPTISGEHLRGILEQARDLPPRPPRLIRRNDVLALAALLIGLFLSLWLKIAGNDPSNAGWYALACTGLYGSILVAAAITAFRRGRWRYQRSADVR
jgi:hypothetical protein